MSEYIDKYGRYHDKPCKDGEPSSNNGWIYTAYALKLRLSTNSYKLDDCYDDCWSKDLTYMNRSPNDETPPMSRDEILGIFYIRYVRGNRPFRYPSWNFCPYHIPKFNLFKTIGALYRMINKDRNGLWENGGEPHLYRFAFSVPFQDRAYMLKMADYNVPIIYRVAELISRFSPFKSKSSKLIHWLKYGDEPDYELFKAYFGEQHPFTIKAKQTTKYLFNII